MRLLITSLALAALSAASGASRPALEPAPGKGAVALRAGKVYTVENDRVLENGTVLIRDGRIAAVGTDVAVPPGVRVVDYGESAVIVPGLVAAYTNYGRAIPSRRTAAPGVHAIDGFDFYESYHVALGGGVTTAYLTPAEGRLIAGAGGVVKLAGEDHEARVLRAEATIHAAVDRTARETPGYWDPPLPATVDVGIGYMEPQLPRTAMGAIVGLQELVAAARAQDASSGYGPFTARDLGELMEAGAIWRVGAEKAAEIRAVLELASENELPLVIDKGDEADQVAAELAAAGVGVIFRVPFQSQAVDRGKDEDARWPDYGVPARLVEAGASVAIACASPRDLMFAAALASRGGLDEARALEAITLAPARMLGVADRVGSLAVGKDADIAVLTDTPVSGSAGVVEIWVGGESVWDPEEAFAAADAARRAAEGKVHERASAPPTVLRVDELHVGDGTVIRPGQLLMVDGKIAEVGSAVSRPPGAVVVNGKAAMPGIVDGLGHLGLEGSNNVPRSDFEMSSIVGPGDRVDRKVAAGGVTTVVLSPRGASKSGAPVMAYKPAASRFEGQVVGDPVALRLRWTESNRLESGKDVRELLEKGKEYRQEWLEYEKAIAEWKPAPPRPADDDEATGEEGEGEDEEAADEDEDDDKKSKKKKKDEDEELEPDPITGIWEASLARAPRPEPAPLKLRMVFEPGKGSGPVRANLRCAAVSDELVELEGTWSREDLSLSLTGLGTQGWVSLALKHDEKKLEGTLTVGGEELPLSCERTSKEFRVTRRPERGSPESDDKEPKDKPKMPKLDAGLEVVRGAIEGRATLIVEVDRADEIVDCVDACAKYGVRPVLYGASDAHLVVDRLVGRVAGVLLQTSVVRYSDELGARYRTPYADLQNAGIRVAFHSDAEEGAIDLPVIAAYAVAHGMSRAGALRALTADVADMFSIEARVGRLETGKDADVLLLDGAPLDPRSSFVRAWVNGVEVVDQ